MRHLALSAIVAFIVSLGVSCFLCAPLAERAGQSESRLQRIEKRVLRLAKIANLVFGEDGE
jgi:hypothetical protein